MKNLIILAIALFSFQIANAQVKIGLKAGMSTSDISTDQLAIRNLDNIKTLGLSIEEASYGFHFGLVTQAKIGGFFIQPEVLLNTTQVDYVLEEFGEGSVTKRLLTDQYHNLDIPVMMGLKFGPLRLQAGPVAHMQLGKNSELEDVDGININFDKWTYGYQTGIGLDVWKLMLDVRYEGNFNKLGDGITFMNRDFSFDERPGKLVASLSYTF